MLFHTLAGFVVPWIVGAFFIRKAGNTVLLVFPITALLALLFNDIGAYLEWWELTPHHMESVITIPYSLGLYPMVLTFMYQYALPRVKPFGFILLTAFLLTCSEFALVLMKYVKYSDGWNIGWTLVSYIISCSLVFLYTRLWRKTSRHGL